MLEGTDLMSAYQPLTSQSSQEYYAKEDDYVQQQPTTQPVVQQKKEQPAPQRMDDSLLNKQFETDQKIAALVAELKKKKNTAAAAPQEPEQPSYFDKLFGKKKELYKVLQLSLIITLGLSLHFLIDHYLTRYLAEHEMSFERQLILRLLYPAAVLFIIWNLRVFVK